MDSLVRTTGGRVQGAVTGAVAAFKGIPYAAPPVGDLRFAAPAPAPAWDEVRDATRFGPTALEPPYRPPLDRLLPDPVIPGDDILTLNVWTGDLTGSRPVFVWIHGGAFVHGSSAVPIYDGHNFARDGVVFVSINYRLGAHGFALLDDAPANRGLLDQVAALRWVRDNIAAFGGDPDLVTIAGESAGAMSVAALLAMPITAGEKLFHRAVLQSGAGHAVLSADTAYRVSAAVADVLGTTPDRHGLGSVPAEDLLAAQETVVQNIRVNPDPSAWGEIVADSMAFAPCVDGEVLPGRPIDRIAEGASSDVDVLIGTNADEFTLFFVPYGVDRVVDETMLHRLVAAHRLDVDTALTAYRRARPAGSSAQILMDVLRDRMFRIPAVRVAEARRKLDAPTYVYRFDWPSPEFDGKLGATHALEIGFVFDNLELEEITPLAGPKPPQVLADRLHRAWVEFTGTGTPGWPAYGGDRVEMTFGDICETVSDPDGELRRLWDGIR